MSLDPSFDQTDPAPNPAEALQALLVVSPAGRIQFATARADLWMRDLFAAASPLDRLPEVLTRWLYDGTSGGLCLEATPPPSGGTTRARASGKAALQKITACRRFPIDHLAGSKNSGELPQHEVLGQLAPTHATRGRDRLGNRTQ